MEENLRSLARKKAAEETRRSDEKRAMEEYNAMVEAQERARLEVRTLAPARCDAVDDHAIICHSLLQAVRAMYARQDKLVAIADDKRKEMVAAEAEEKDRTLR